MEEKERRQYRKMTLTPPGRLIATLAVPTVISMMITMIYNLVDAFFVGKLGTSASAAVGVVASVQAVFQAVGFMFGHGSGAIISRSLSQGDTHTSDRILTGSLFVGTGFSILVMTCGILFLTPLMRFLGSTETILPYSSIYAFYILISGPALTASCVLNNVLRYEGQAFYAMFGLVAGGVLNMIGDPILMFGCGLGITGAAISTAVSQYISFGILLYMFFSGRTISRIRPFSVHVRISDIFHVVRNGLPSLIRQLLNSVSTMILNRSAMPFGDPAIAAMAIAGRVMMFMGSVLIGIGQGFQPVSAFNYGARKYNRLRKAFWFTIKASTVFLGVFAVLGFLFPGRIVQVFRDDPEVVRLGIPAVRCMCVAVVVQPVSVAANMMLQSIGKSRAASFLALLRIGLYYLPLLLILPSFLGFFGIQSSQMFADILATLTSIPFVIRFFRSIPREDEVTDMDLQMAQYDDET